MTEDAWYVRHFDGIEHGPYSLDSLVESATLGNIASDSEVRHEKHTQNQWVLAFRIRQIREASPAQTQPPEIQPRESTSATDVEQATADIRYRHSPYKSRREPIVPKTLASAFLAIFDFQFRYYVTPWIVKIQWFLCVAMAMLMVSLVAFALVAPPLFDAIATGQESPAEVDFNQPPVESSEDETSPPVRWSSNSWTLAWGRLIVFVIFLFVCFSTLLYIRLILESIIVLFQIATDVGDLRRVADVMRSKQVKV